MLKIGKAELRHGLMLGPMAGYSDRSMRLVCHELGAEYSVTEMVSAKALAFGDKKTYLLARIKADEGPCAIQIFGSNPDDMAYAAEKLSRPQEDGTAPVAIDINMGCPVHKIFSNGEGSALMKSPELIEKIVRTVSGNIDIPCTVKLRAGVDRDNINAVECAMAAEAGGAALVTIHGRTRAEMYSGRADREIIKKVKQSLHIPVIANGDIVKAEDALDMLRDTGADGVMVARGAVGNPFIFGNIAALLLGREPRFPSLAERAETALRQLSVAIEERGEERAVTEARKQVALYFSEFRGSAALRARVNRATTYREVSEAISEVLSGTE